MSGYGADLWGGYGLPPGPDEQDGGDIEEIDIDSLSDEQIQYLAMTDPALLADLADRAEMAEEEEDEDDPDGEGDEEDDDDEG
jgi:hypothetical protein